MLLQIHSAHFTLLANKPEVLHHKIKSLQHCKTGNKITVMSYMSHQSADDLC